MLTSPRTKPILAALSGLLIVFALSPHDHWYLAWFGLVPLLLSLAGTSPRQAAALGLVTGAVTNYGAFHWLTVLMNDFSNLGILTYFVMLLMALYQSLPFVMWALLLRTADLTRGSRPAGALTMLLCALSLPVFEYFYPIVFPWYLANTQHSQNNLTGVIELAGAGLLSTAIVVVNLVLARLLLPLEVSDTTPRLWPVRLNSRSRLVLALTATLTLLFCYGFSVLRNEQIDRLTQKADKLHLGLVQPNHWIKSVEGVEALHDYQRLTWQMVREAEESDRPLDLVLWPESAVRTPATRFLSQRGPSVVGEPTRYPMDLREVWQGVTQPAAELALERVPQEELLSLQRGHKTPLLFGSTLQDMSPQARGALPGGPALYNCGVLLDEQGRVAGIAPKVKLLLFGETIPLSGVFPFVYRLLPLASALLPGKEAVTFDFKGHRIGMMICYEDLLPWFHYELAKKKPTLLLNLTNDAWFGKTAEAEAHLSLAKFRSVEGRVFLVRSTPTGVSAMIDAKGSVVAQIAQDEAGTLTYPVALLDIETGFERFGDSVVWFGLLLLIGYLALRFRRSRIGAASLRSV